MMTQAERELTAVRWLIEQDDSAFSDAQTHQLAKWLVQSHQNSDAYIRMVRAWLWTALLYSDEPLLVQGRHGSGPPSARTRSPQLSSRVTSLNHRLSDLLRCLREDQGLSAAELADRSGMTSRLEKAIDGNTDD